MKRRDFLKGCLIGGAAASLGAPSKSWAVGSFEGYPDAMGVLVDTTRCIGCRSCEAACNKEQKLPEPDVPFDDTSVFEEKRRTTEKAYTVVNRYEAKDGQKPPLSQNAVQSLQRTCLLNLVFCQCLYKNQRRRSHLQRQGLRGMPHLHGRMSLQYSGIQLFQCL